MKDQENLRSVLDQIQDDLGKLRSTVSAEDRQLLEEHATFVREMEQELQQAQEPAAGHAVPALETGVKEENTNIPQISKMQIDLMQMELKRIQSEVGITFVHVTHDQEEAMTMADTIAVMNSGRIEQLGTPADLYERPQTAFVAGFLGKSNLLDATVSGEGVVQLLDGSELRARTNGNRGPVAIGVRPEKIRLGDAGVNRLSGTVKESAYIGVATEVVVATSVGELTVFHQNVETGGGAPAPGSPVTLSWEPDATFVVDREKETPE